MLTEQQIELAHPEAFDFVFGTLPTAEGVTFIRHLAGCRHCRAAVDEYGEIGEIIKHLPPRVEPPAGLEERTVAAMAAALAEHKAEPGGHPDAGEPVPHHGGSAARSGHRTLSLITSNLAWLAWKSG